MTDVAGRPLRAQGKSAEGAAVLSCDGDRLVREDQVPSYVQSMVLPEQLPTVTFEPEAR